MTSKGKLLIWPLGRWVDGHPRISLGIFTKPVRRILYIKNQQVSDTQEETSRTIWNLWDWWDRQFGVRFVEMFMTGWDVHDWGHSWYTISEHETTFDWFNNSRSDGKQLQGFHTNQLRVTYAKTAEVFCLQFETWKWQQMLSFCLAQWTGLWKPESTRWMGGKWMSWCWCCLFFWVVRFVARIFSFWIFFHSFKELLKWYAVVKLTFVTCKELWLQLPASSHSSHHHDFVALYSACLL